MSEWRPEDGWDSYWDAWRLLPDSRTRRSLNRVDFEAGADAIVAAIWKMARESATGTFVFDTHYFGNHAVVYDSEVHKVDGQTP